MNCTIKSFSDCKQTPRLSYQLGRRQDCMGEGWAVQLMRGVHHFVGEGRGGVRNQGYVITKPHREAAGGFDAGVGPAGRSRSP